MDKELKENPDSPGGNSSSSMNSTSNPKDIPSTSTSNKNIPMSPTMNMFPSLSSASPPSFISMEQILKVAEDVSKSEFDMALAHEIAVNTEFYLKKSEPSSGLEKRVKETLHEVFWDILKDELSSNPPNYTQAMVLLNEVKEILLGLLLPHNTRIKNEIKDVLDIELIKQQAEKGTVDVHSYAQFIISTMARICAPVRSEKVQQLRELTDVVALFREILGVLDLMKLDMANFTIDCLRPHIQQHSIEYEKQKFQEILNSLSALSPPIDGLKFTRLWLQEVAGEILEDNPETANSVILRKAFLKVLRWEETENFPETLHLDHERFIGMKNKLTTMILTASVILVTYSHVGPSIQEISEFKEELKRHIQIILADAHQCRDSKELEMKMEAVGMQVIKEVNICLQKHGFTVLTPEKEETLLSLIKQISVEDHHVRQIIMKRILEFLELALQSPSTVKVPVGLSSLQKELLMFAAQFLALVRHNQAVFGESYTEILNQCKAHQ